MNTIISNTLQRIKEVAEKDRWEVYINDEHCLYPNHFVRDMFFTEYGISDSMPYFRFCIEIPKNLYDDSAGIINLISEYKDDSNLDGATNNYCSGELYYSDEELTEGLKDDVYKYMKYVFEHIDSLIDKLRAHFALSTTPTC